MSNKQKFPMTFELSLELDIRGIEVLISENNIATVENAILMSGHKVHELLEILDCYNNDIRKIDTVSELVVAINRTHHSKVLSLGDNLHAFALEHIKLQYGELDPRLEPYFDTEQYALDYMDDSTYMTSSKGIIVDFIVE